jgi:hypothetical protein
MEKFAKTTVVLVVAFCFIICGKWYFYVTSDGNVYDEIGIQLNSRMPLPLRKWGCDQLQARFPQSLPPYGCSATNGLGWI